MSELSLEYWNQLANQLIFISALLGGFTLTMITSLSNFKAEKRTSNLLFNFTIVAASAFLVTIYAMTKIMMMTTKGFPVKIEESEILFPRLIGSITFLLGTLSLFIIISLAGWTKSKKLGMFATTIGILALILILLVIV